MTDEKSMAALTAETEMLTRVCMALPVSRQDQTRQRKNKLHKKRVALTGTEAALTGIESWGLQSEVDERTGCRST
ncbi:hypothetical protein EH105704_03_01770 [Atlantibacter hermannii NBRC 105704]|uniref:Uncharacterized protein n=1 Tax=Atlantibacter hermannii NBRC 105704 TaxID=1115512 RepID=H5V114_ATLHE|nr:hypothetical protein EH105704_03_01770 [Atlantibacter hermannii NBRC 105704]